MMSPKLTEDDSSMIQKAHDNPEDILSKVLIREIDEIENEFARDHLLALGWMIAEGHLHLRVALVCDERGAPIPRSQLETTGLFHQKVGILTDARGDTISFSGSNNETGSAWTGNIEEFKVFRNWIPDERHYVQADVAKFERFWLDKARRVKVLDVPRAVREKLIQIVPKSFDIKRLHEWYAKEGSETTPEPPMRVRLWDHQERAISSWVNHGKRGIFEMATATGKTFAALGCLDRILKSDERLIALIACPFQHLLDQWSEAMVRFGLSMKSVRVDSTNPQWRNQLVDSLLDMRSGMCESFAVLATHASASSPDFINIVRDYGNTGESFKYMLIADEVHNLAPEERRQGLLGSYDFRLGLSATPKRWMDEKGTQILYDYFGDTVFEFSLKDAIREVNPDTGQTYLTPYEYRPVFVQLSEDELLQYSEKTRKIGQAYHQSRKDDDRRQLFDRLCIERAKIIKRSQNKYPALDEILTEIGKPTHCLVYCDSMDQLKVVQRILDAKKIIHHKFTSLEDADERQSILDEFAKGTYEALVAIKCLDEGVDVPAARLAVILASSTNPREYIQRRGRVLRRSEGKEKAIVYDVIVAPSVGKASADVQELETRILLGELKRYREFARIALNSAECLGTINRFTKQLTSGGA